MQYLIECGGRRTGPLPSVVEEKGQVALLKTKQNEHLLPPKIVLLSSFPGALPSKGTEGAWAPREKGEDDEVVGVFCFMVFIRAPKSTAPSPHASVTQDAEKKVVDVVFLISTTV